MDLLLHPADERGHTRPHPRGRLSTVGHREAFRAFAEAARAAGIRFMIIGGTFRDVAVRSASTRDIDVVLIDRKELDPEMMRAAGFSRVSGSPQAWRYRAGDRTVDVEVAALASSTEPTGPFSVAFQHAERRTIEGLRAAVPRVDDYVILKLFAAAADRRRLARDLADVQHVLDAFPERSATELSIPAVRARLRDLYGVWGERLKDMLALLRQVPRPAKS